MADETSWAVALWVKYGRNEAILLSSRYAARDTLLMCCCIDSVWSSVLSSALVLIVSVVFRFGVDHQCCLPLWCWSSVVVFLLNVDPQWLSSSLVLILSGWLPLWCWSSLVVFIFDVDPQWLSLSLVLILNGCLPLWCRSSVVVFPLNVDPQWLSSS